MDGCTSETSVTLRSGSGTSAFDSAVEMVEYFEEWIDWDNDAEITQKTLAGTLAVITTSELDELIPQVTTLLRDELANGAKSRLADICSRFFGLRQKLIKEAGSFVNTNCSKEDIARLSERSYQIEIACALVEYLLALKPCCRMIALAKVIPAIAAGVPAVNLVAHTAEELAGLMNDPVEPFIPGCTSIGNSWLHRLGIYLLHHCHLRDQPPPPSLVRLMSLVSLPPSASAKGGKATRLYDFMVNAPYPKCLHESPPTHMIGKMLWLELLGELDANRQEEHLRRVETAVAFYGFQLLSGYRPEDISVKSVQDASGLSWSDADQLMRRPYFRRLVFQEQCRALSFRPCQCGANKDIEPNVPSLEGDLSSETAK